MKEEDEEEKALEEEDLGVREDGRKDEGGLEKR